MKTFHQQRMQPQSELSSSFDSNISAPTTSPTFVASAANACSSQSFSKLASTEATNASLSSPVTSPLALSQASSSKIVSFEDPHQGWETHFEFHMRSNLSKKTRKCSGNCHKTTTQFDGLLMRSRGNSSLHNLRTGKEQSTTISRMTA